MGKKDAAPSRVHAEGVLYHAIAIHGNDEERILTKNESVKTVSRCVTWRAATSLLRHCSPPIRQPSWDGPAGLSEIPRRGDETGHDEKYYQSLDQRFLGKDSFIQEAVRRTETKEF
jgi:hypothetical protein